jgi:hypothetical protein
MLKRNWALIALVYLTFAEILSLAPVPDLALCLIEPEHGQQATDHNEKKYCPAFHTGIVASLDAIDGFLERHDKSVIGAFTIVLAISTIGLWLATNRLWSAGERQLDLLADTSATQSRDMEKALIAANRAWIKIQIGVGGPIEYNVNGANFTLIYMLENVGKSPALNIVFHPRLIDYATGGITGELLKHIQLRKEFSIPASFGYGYALFPGEKLEQPITVSMTQEQIKEAAKQLPAIYPAVIGSVTYRTGLDDAVHQTGFAVQIHRSEEPRPFTTERNYAHSVIWTEEGDVPADQVRLSRSFLEGGYAD